jgi:hypothetical protein
MAETLRLFVSATKDLEAERAIIGRAVAELPVKIGIEIRRTPATGAAYEDIYELIANCDRVYFLMGRDITAPSGAEWFIAWKLERSVLPLRLAGLPTPAGQDFVRLLPSGIGPRYHARFSRYSQSSQKPLWSNGHRVGVAQPAPSACHQTWS